MLEAMVVDAADAAVDEVDEMDVSVLRLEDRVEVDVLDEEDEVRRMVLRSRDRWAAAEAPNSDAEDAPVAWELLWWM
jgi:hypothetical protein